MRPNREGQWRLLRGTQLARRKINQRWGGHFWQKEQVQSTFRGPVARRNKPQKRNWKKLNVTKWEGTRKSGVWDESYEADRPQTTQRLAGLANGFWFVLLRTRSHQRALISTGWKYADRWRQLFLWERQEGKRAGYARSIVCWARGAGYSSIDQVTYALLTSKTKVVVAFNKRRCVYCSSYFPLGTEFSEEPRLID